MRGLLLGAVFLACTAQARTTSYALVIGNNAPPTGGLEALPTLRYADDDAARYFKFFERLSDERWALSVLDDDSQRRYPEVTALARPPSIPELKSAVEQIASRVRADVARGDEPVVYFTFSGHGAREADGTFYLALSDGKLTRQQLYDDVLAKFEPAFVHLFIDACHSEALVAERGKLGRDLEVPTVAVDPQQAQIAFAARLPARFSRVGVITATTVDQQAHEWSRIESGVFTHELLSGLSGAADVNHDGMIEYSELKAFIASANRDISDPRATPKVVAVAPRINVHSPVLALANLKNTGFLSGLFKIGHFHIELENGQRLIDANLLAEQAAKIALPAGRMFLVASGKEVEFQIRAGETTRFETLKLTPPRAEARGSVDAALNRALFQSSFGATYYKGYTDSTGEVPVIFRALPSQEVSVQVSQHKVLASTAICVSVALLIGSMVTTVGAVNNWGEYSRTNLQRPAFEARERANGFTAAAATTGASAVAVGVLAWWLWPAKPDQVSVTAHLGAGTAGLALSGHW